MYKKAGIVVSLTIIAIACGIFWFVHSQESGEKEGVVTTPPSSNTETVKQPVTKQEVVGAVETPKVVEPVVVAQPVEKAVITQPVEQPITDVSGVRDHVFYDVDPDSLGKAVSKHTEVMIVSKKKAVVLDGQYGKKENKQLVFVLELMYGNETMDFYLNGSAYQGINVGDKLKVDYEIHKNDVGVSFPVIMSVIKAE